MNNLTQVPDCEHHYTIHIRGGEPLHVRLCTLCGGVDWTDLREQYDSLTEHKRAPKHCQDPTCRLCRRRLPDDDWVRRQFKWVIVELCLLFGFGVGEMVFVFTGSAGIATAIGLIVALMSAACFFTARRRQ